MAHTNSRPIDFTAPINENGSIITGVKQALIKTFRALAGKSVLVGNSVAFAATVAVPVAPLSFQVKAGKQYRITGKLFVTADATSGSKFGLSLPGSSAPTAQIVFKHYLATTMSAQAVTTFTNETGIAGLTLEVDIDGYFTPDVSGLLSLQAATFTAVAPGSVNPGSWLSVFKVRG